MAYLIITDKQHELDRHELIGPAVIGRSPDCDVVVRDVLLSRHHCRVEQNGAGQWMVSDLGSKNGTYVETHKVQRYVLSDTDIVRAGRTRIIFREGKFIPPPPEVLQRKAARRPADPIEALAGTMVGFEFTDMEENSRITGFPIPKPRPAEPVGRRAASQPQSPVAMTSPAPARRASRDFELKLPPIEHDLKHPVKTAPPEWDLGLRETTPSPAPAPLPPPPRQSPAPAAAGKTFSQVTFIDSPPDESVRQVARSATRRQFATNPQWFVLVCGLLFYLLCGLAVWLVSWR